MIHGCFIDGCIFLSAGERSSVEELLSFFAGFYVHRRFMDTL